MRYVPLIVCLMALLAAACGGPPGVDEIALHAAPCLLLLGLLARGRFIGEEAILARRVAPARLRPAVRRWIRSVERPLASRLGRTCHRLRGPPATALT